MPGLTPDQVSAGIERDRIAQIAADEQMERDRQKQEESRAARIEEETIPAGHNPR